MSEQRAVDGMDGNGVDGVDGVDARQELAAPRVTRRELEVLNLVADGRTNRQIGELLFISEKTASVHVTNLLRKLGVANRVEAATMAQRTGLTAQASAKT
jgi:DNA-binding NarL/FixJ family response regulator